MLRWHAFVASSSAKNLSFLQQNFVDGMKLMNPKQLAGFLLKNSST